MPEEWTVNPTKYAEKDVNFQEGGEENIQFVSRICQIIAKTGWIATTPFKYYTNVSSLYI